MAGNLPGFLARGGRPVIRTLALIVRRTDVSRREFRDHYEEIHAPLALPFMTGLQHYLRNHVAEALSGPEPGFDVMTEFGYARAEDVGHIVGILESPEGDPIRRDELTFMDTQRNTFFAIGDPVRVAGGEPLGDRWMDEHGVNHFRHGAAVRAAFQSADFKPG